ncbi:MAG TPA: ATP-binding protein [Terriglobales bacterium]|jgi:signal transduction histidine kinase
MSAVVQFRKLDRDGNAADSQSEGMEVLGRVVSSVAHDFNNLITGVLLYSDLLSKELPPDSRLHRHVQGIRRAGENGAALIQQLLTVAKPQTDEAGVAVGPVITEMYDLLTRLAGGNIELVLVREPGQARVRMSSAQLQRVLLNLVLNARDAMPDGGRICLTAHARTEGAAPEIELIVEDNGCGMDEEVQAHLFQPFFTTKAHGSGNGLGLFTVRNIVSRSGGELSVNSAPGKGTRISIRLPITESPEDSNQARSNPDRNSQDRNRKKR